MIKARARFAFLSASLGALLSAATHGARAELGFDAERTRLLEVVASVCERSTPVEPRAAYADAVRSHSEPVVRRGRERGTRFMFGLAGGDEMRVDVLTSYQRRVRVNAEYRRGRGGALRPSTLVIADGQCTVRGARRLEYEGGEPVRLLLLARDVRTELGRELLDAPLPDPAPGADSAGVRVAMVDSGVNYGLREIASRVARDATGAMLGYDYWDMDPRPFDANVSGSPYAPRRHGTKTASLLLAEAPVASLAPYRYPRPDMRRMEDLVVHARDNGIRIVNLSLGGGDRDEWATFVRAARGAPDVLFVASAGNTGSNLDDEPVYPAAFDLPNLLTVTSANADGTLASGSSYGLRTVHLMVPAEDQPVTGFDGHARIASGSSYAAARVSALAACLLAAAPSMSGAELARSVLALAGEAPGVRRTSHGLLPDPSRLRRGACEPDAAEPRLVRSRAWTRAASARADRVHVTHTLSPTVVRLRGGGWREQTARAALEKTDEILGQCGIAVEDAEILTVSAPRRMSYFRDDWSSALIRAIDPGRPAAFLVKGTLQPAPYEAEAIGFANGRRRPDLIGTAWLTLVLEHPGLALAHELVHLLTDSGAHDPDDRNLMHERTSATGTRLREGQCMQMLSTGEKLGLLRPVERR